MAAAHHQKQAATSAAVCAVVGLVAICLNGCDHEAVKTFVNEKANITLSWAQAHYSNCTDTATCMQQLQIASQQAAAAASEQAQVHAEAAQAAMVNNGHLNWTMQAAVAASDEAAAAAQQAAANAQVAAQNMNDKAQQHLQTAQDWHAQAMGDSTLSGMASQVDTHAQQLGAQAQQVGAQAQQYGAQAQQYITQGGPTAAPPAQLWLAIAHVRSSHSLLSKVLPVAVASAAAISAVVAAVAFVVRRRRVVATSTSMNGDRDEALFSRAEAGLE